MTTTYNVSVEISLWLRSDESSKRIWGDQILTNNSIMLEDRFSARIGAKDQCLRVIFNNDAEKKDQSATLVSWNCNTKSIAICSLHKSEFDNTSERQKFPCMRQNVKDRKTRKVRDATDDDIDLNKQTENDRGM